jgi:hypothetical protein
MAAFGGHEEGGFGGAASEAIGWPRRNPTSVKAPPDVPSSARACPAIRAQGVPLTARAPSSATAARTSASPAAVMARKMAEGVRAIFISGEKVTKEIERMGGSNQDRTHGGMGEDGGGDDGAGGADPHARPRSVPGRRSWTPPPPPSRNPKRVGTWEVA